MSTVRSRTTRFTVLAVAAGFALAGAAEAQQYRDRGTTDTPRAGQRGQQPYFGIFEADPVRDDPYGERGDTFSGSDYRWGYYDPDDREGIALYRWDDDARRWVLDEDADEFIERFGHRPMPRMQPPRDDTRRATRDRTADRPARGRLYGDAETRRDDDRWSWDWGRDRESDRRYYDREPRNLPGYFGIYESDPVRDDPYHEAGDAVSGSDYRWGYYDPERGKGTPLYRWDDDRRQWVLHDDSDDFIERFGYPRGHDPRTLPQPRTSDRGRVDRDRRGDGGRFDWDDWNPARWGDRDGVQAMQGPYFGVYESDPVWDDPYHKIGDALSGSDLRWGYYDPERRKGVPLYRWDDDAERWVRHEDADEFVERFGDRPVPGMERLRQQSARTFASPERDRLYDEQERRRMQQLDQQRRAQQTQDQVRRWQDQPEQQRRLQEERQRQERVQQQTREHQTLDRPRQAQIIDTGAARLAGEVEDYRRTTLRDDDGRSRQANLLLVRLDNGRTTVVDIGERLSIDDLDLRRNDRVTVTGTREYVGGRAIFKADSIRVGGQEFDTQRGTRTRNR